MIQVLVNIYEKSTRSVFILGHTISNCSDVYFAISQCNHIFQTKGTSRILTIVFLFRANLRTQKRLAASVIGVGKRKVWLDPNETTEIANANSRSAIRKLYKNGTIVKKPETVHSRSRARALKESKRAGRHMGYGKEKVPKTPECHLKFYG